MSSSLAYSRIALVAGLMVLGLSACGRRGALEPPPDAAAAQTQEEAVGQSQGVLPAPVGTPRASSAPQRSMVPNKPFILDPLL